MLRQKGILILLQGETLTTIMMHIANALPAAPPSLTGTVRNADIPMLIRDGSARNIDSICSKSTILFIRSIHLHIPKLEIIPSKTAVKIKKIYYCNFFLAKYLPVKLF